MSEPEELELTSDLRNFVDRITTKLVGKHCPTFVKADDVAQEAMLELIRKPPKYDPSRGASKKTLIYTIVQRVVLKYAARRKRDASRFKQFPRVFTTANGPPRRPFEDRPAPTTKFVRLDDILEFIDDEPSRDLCRLYVRCDANVSEVARRMGVSEGTIRYRLTKLGPRMIRAGFDPACI